MDFPPRAQGPQHRTASSTFRTQTESLLFEQFFSEAATEACFTLESSEQVVEHRDCPQVISLYFRQPHAFTRLFIAHYQAFSHYT